MREGAQDLPGEVQQPKNSRREYAHLCYRTPQQVMQENSVRTDHRGRREA
jgi:hypothetical protein